MPLPSALAERLAKRGLIPKERTSILKKKSDEVEEEIIAESYDEPSKVKKQPDFANKKSNCPNQSNPYHECTKYCFEKYGEKKFRPNLIMEKRRIRMLKIYPLPPNWIEVPDINTNRYYYWNIHTNDVCWMSPSCPKAKIEQPKKPQKKVEVTKSIQDKLDEFMQDIDSEAKQPQTAINRESSSSKQESSSSSKKNSSSSSSSSSSKKVKLNNSEPLDPMDPASYSDIPRGKWSDGLEGSGKNAADDSASGPLFQQRPYPSPGQVLKSNKN